MRTKRNLLISMLLKEFKMIFKVIAKLSILIAVLDILNIVELNSKVPLSGFQFLYFSIASYLISGLFAYFSYRYEIRFNR